ncbi:hypothetical protein F5Y17DRAFT_333199 [Xylariaceae sp. FL0594]|nr:hypothetical protein F5Y17DRAFT_333199 [Xylariaceae sp. FL0594]
MKEQDPRVVDLGGRLGKRDVGRGAIVNIGSLLAIGVLPGKAPYVTSKHALTGITKAAAMDLKPYGIRVNQVNPTWVQTPMFEEECRRRPKTKTIVKDHLPLKRAVLPDEIAAVCVYLCSPASLAVNGHGLAIDDGLLVGQKSGV